MSYAATSAVLVLVVTLALYVIFHRKNGIETIPGPSSPSWMFGHMRQLMHPPTLGDYEYRWLKEYGPVYRLKGCFGSAITKPSFEQVALAITEQLEQSVDPIVDICPVMGVATLRTVSEAVLGHPTEDLGEEFVSCTSDIVHLGSSQSAAQILADAIGAWLPAWVAGLTIYLPTTTCRLLLRERNLAAEVGERIVRQKFDAARQGLEMNNDTFSRLLNPDPSDKTRELLTGEDIAAQNAIILIAGKDTTAFSGSGRGTVAYDNMPLLNAFIKESLRVYPAEAFTDRVALRDTVIPLSTEITTLNGERISQLAVRKGQLVTVAAASYHRFDPSPHCKSVPYVKLILHRTRLESSWGSDAHEFKPSR
ncbi:cytochrome P450 [Mycena crocata]|nr:cytochrome P450 [Mycena crocata]